MAERSCSILTVLCIFVLAFTTYAQDSKFLSISCGASESFTSTDNYDGEGIEWITDDDFITTGKKLEVDSFGYSTSTLRYFDKKRSKHCYVLPAVPDTTYLIRASIDPGLDDSTGMALPVNFTVYVDSNDWFPYSLAEGDDRGAVFPEGIFHIKTEEVFLCLVQSDDDVGFPFISAIEMRALPSTTYAVAEATGVYMYQRQRINLGSGPNSTYIRYPQDPFDRYWYADETTPRVVNSSRLAQLSEDEMLAPGYNQPPEIVLTDGLATRGVSFPLGTPPAGYKYLLVGHFQEIRPEITEASAEANPCGMLFGAYGEYMEVNLTSLRPVQASFVGTSGDGGLNLTLLTQPWSKRVAIINAVELYYLFSDNSSVTARKDATAMKAVLRNFQLTDWTGDACYPVSWDWVTCDPDTSRITKLQLSNMNITGSIPDEIADMSALTEIYLDNNNISGSIPPQMTTLTKLKILALDNNTLSGEIPSAFQNKEGFTFTGNPRLICPIGDESCVPVSNVTVDDKSGTKGKFDDDNEKMYITVIVVLGVITSVRSWLS